MRLTERHIFVNSVAVGHDCFNLLRTARLPLHYRVHDLRHTFGQTLRRRGVPLETIMGLMRHADIAETMIYAKYDPIEGAREIKKLRGFTG